MNNCYITLMTNEKYLPCVIRAAQTFQYFKSKYPYIVMIPKHNSFLKNNLIKHNIQFKEIEIYKLIDDNPIFYNDTINKFQLFNFIEYDNICFLDADSFFIGNVDREFEKAKNHNFYGYFESTRDDRKTRLMGGLFIAKPNPNFFSEILKLKNKNDWYDDEALLTQYFNKNDHAVPLIDEYMHFGGFIKPWESWIHSPKIIQDFFTSMPDEQFYYWITHIREFLGEIRQWSLNFEKGNLNAHNSFITIPKDLEEIKKSLKLKKQLEEFGSIYNLLLCIDKSLLTFDILKYLDDNETCFLIFDNIKNLSICQILNFLQKNKKFEFFDNLCYFNSADFQIQENLDLLLHRHTNITHKKEILKKYKSKIFLLKNERYHYVD